MACVGVGTERIRHTVLQSDRSEAITRRRSQAAGQSVLGWLELNMASMNQSGCSVLSGCSVQIVRGILLGLWLGSTPSFPKKLLTTTSECESGRRIYDISGGLWGTVDE